MKKFYFIFFLFFTFQNLFFAQVLNLGSLVNFVLFTSNGAVSNVGTSTLTGNIGADIGAISGFESAIVSGTLNNIDEVTELAKNDLDLFYNQLTTFPVTNDIHLSALGSSEVLTAGVFLISSAGSIAGNLTLDGQGDSNSIFIFKIVGAFTTGISTNVILINNAFVCNIYWLVEGAISIGATSTMKGTFVSNNGAILMASGGNLEGRMFSTTGAIAIDQIVATKQDGCAIYSAIPLPVELLSFTADCSENLVNLNWSTGSENNNNFFTVESSRDGINWNNIGHVIAAGNSSSTTNYSLVDLTQYFGISYYRLKQTDFDGEIRTFSPISVEKCFYSETDLTIFPNPVKNTFKIDYTGDKGEVLSVSVCDIHGEFIYSSAIFNSEIMLENVRSGIYFLHLVLKTKRVIRKFSVVN